MFACRAAREPGCIAACLATVYSARGSSLLHHRGEQTLAGGTLHGLAGGRRRVLVPCDQLVSGGARRNSAATGHGRDRRRGDEMGGATLPVIKRAASLPGLASRFGKSD